MKSKIFYSPKENHLAIVYTDRRGYDRFRGFVDETQRTWLRPKLLTRRYVLKEHYLGPAQHKFTSPMYSLRIVSTLNWS